ncbi:MAG: hypothetical protein VKK97_11685, partial [Synechococcaceae cyanobacterium]|nr:hypothetical protein [Synechococcaceae cyanobacterium]
MTAPSPCVPEPSEDDPDDPLALPLPPHTVLLEGDAAELEPVEAPRLALRAVRQQLRELGLELRLREETAADRSGVDPGGGEAGGGEAGGDALVLRLGTLRVLLVCAPFWAETLALPTGPWRGAAPGPHLLLGARVAEECGAVQLPGVLSAAELHQLYPGFPHAADSYPLPASTLRGGLERLFLLAQLMLPQALLPTAPATAPAAAPTRLRDWLDGVLSEALLALGAELLPASAGAFRSTAAGGPVGALATVAIPLGLVAGQIATGSGGGAASERFRLLLRLCGDATGPHWLEVRLEPELAGDLLPQRLSLQVGDRAIHSGGDDSGGKSGGGDESSGDRGGDGAGALALSVPAGAELIAIGLR